MKRTASMEHARAGARGTRRWWGPWLAVSLAFVVAVGWLAVGLAQEAEPGSEEHQAVIDAVFPPDPVEVRDLILHGCTACHGLGLTIFAVDYFDPDRWVVEIGAHRGRGDLRVARLRKEEDIAAVTAYLQKYFVMEMERELPEDIPDWLIGEVEAY